MHIRRLNKLFFSVASIAEDKEMALKTDRSDALVFCCWCSEILLRRWSCSCSLRKVINAR